MTGETKIGLITGLSVIIVFAMILSHKGTGQPEVSPPPRQPDVRSELAADESPPDPLGLPQVRPLDSPTPRKPVEVAAQEENTSRERMAMTSPTKSTEGAPAKPGGESSLPGPFDSEQFVPVTTPQIRPGRHQTMPEELRRQIEGDGAATPEQKEREPAVAPPPPERALPPSLDEPERIYVAQVNDTLTSIARRFLGSGSAGDVERIYELNRDVLPDRDTLRAGQKLRIPVSSATAMDTGRRGSGEPAGKPPRDHSLRTRDYRIQPGDNYGVIAREQLNSGKRWREIYDLNKDRFPDPDLIPAGATIKLPVPEQDDLRLAAR